MQPPLDDVVVGVDTHAETHTAVAVDGLGRVLDTVEVPATAAGYRQLVRWARNHGEVTRAGVEGTGAYGAGLARHLAEVGIEVIEVDRPNRQRRRRRGKSDPTDAEAAARAVLSGEATTVPKDTSGVVEAIRILHVTRRSAVKARTQAGNQMKDLVLTAPEPIRAKLRGLSTRQRVRACAAWRPGTALAADPTTATRRALHDLACRWLVLHDEARMLEAQLLELLTATVPTLMAEPGVGPDSAAKLLIAAGQNPDRLHSEAAFAALCGTSPVENSSGKHTGHRLNRGGDRQANNAIHTIALHRSRRCPETRAYLARRSLDPRNTPRRARRCLKRALARRLYHALMTDLAPLLT
jgi:transposase